MKTMKEMIEEMMKDPDLEDNPTFRRFRRHGERMIRLSDAIMKPCADYAVEHGEDDEGWAYTIMISLARATCNMLYAMQETGFGRRDVYDFYRDELLPQCKQIAYAECDRMAAVDKLAEEDELDRIARSSLRKEVVMAIADPDITAEEIIGRFFRKDMPEEARRGLAARIARVRTQHAGLLRRLREDLEAQKENEAN